jgi:hypothetical protein
MMLEMMENMMKGMPDNMMRTMKHSETAPADSAEPAGTGPQYTSLVLGAFIDYDLSVIRE